MMREDWKEPRLDPPEPQIIGTCADCGEAIYEGETYFRLRGDDYCWACVMAAQRID